MLPPRMIPGFLSWPEPWRWLRQPCAAVSLLIASLAAIASVAQAQPLVVSQPDASPQGIAPSVVAPPTIFGPSAGTRTPAGPAPTIIVVQQPVGPDGAPPVTQGIPPQAFAPHPQSGEPMPGMQTYFADQAMFPAVFPGKGPPPPHNDGSLEGIPFQDFSVLPPCNTFPDCPLPILSWRQGPCAGPRGCGAMDLPAHAVRYAKWYATADLVALKRDGREETVFARRGLLGTGPTMLSSQDFNYPLDAGGNFLIGHRFTDKLAFEASYLGSFEWGDQVFVRNDTPNILGGFGNLSSPFTGFGNPPIQGVDFNNFVYAETTANLESLELNLRYRPIMVPYGPFDVSFLLGFRYLHIDETLYYQTESDFPAPGGAVNILDIATDNDLVGVQIGLTGHTLIYPCFWIDTDLKGGMYNNYARQRTVYEFEENGQTGSFLTTRGVDDTAFSGDVRIVGNYQILPRLTVRLGYQATWVTGIATGVSNFETNLDTLTLGPGRIRATDTNVYHGPLLGLTWVR
jgi:hypothetical protein